MPYYIVLGGVEGIVQDVLAASLQAILSRSLHLCTPYSMNRLFSEFFRKFGGAFLEVYETISGGIWQVFRGKIKENYLEKIRNILLDTIKYY